MKKKFLILMAAVTAMLASVSAVSACSSNDHKHFYTRELTKEATCTEKGEWTYNCSCGSKYTAEISALGHDEKIYKAKEATCIEPGWEEYVVCQREGCDYSTYQGEIPVTGVHIWDNGEVTTPPTCTEEGVKTFTCTVCENETKTETVGVIPHTYAQGWSSDSTNHWHECACGDRKDEAGHVPSAPATLTTPQVCTVCNHLLQARTGIEFNTLTVDGLAVYGTVSNATTQFSFTSEIKVVGDATYVIKNADQTIAAEVVSLVEGDNVFYLIQKNGEEIVNTYTITLRRRPMYEVAFDVNGGTAVEMQSVEEDGFATAPSVAPTKAGYTFQGWDYDFTQAITKNTKITALWSANLNTKYTVVYYLQNLEDDNYKADKTVELSGKTDTTATAEIKTYEHFTHNESESTISGVIAGDGSLVLSVYYTRNGYTITTACNNAKAGTVSAGGTYKYGAEITLTATTTAGYSFLGWFDGDTRVSTEEVYTVTVEKNTTYTAKWSTNTGTKYTVEYYLQNVDNDGYTLHETVTSYGTTSATAMAEKKTYGHFTYNASESTIRGVIAGDGSLVLSVYYTRNSYTIATANSDEKAGSVTSLTGTYRYGKEVTLTATPKVGYAFLGWYEGETLVGETEVFTLQVNKNATYTAKWSTNTGTKYTVEYYLQNVDNDGYTLHEKVTSYGTTSATATAEKKTYEHFTYNASESTISGIISGDGGLVLSVYYTRNSYTITTTGNNAKAGTVEGGGTYKYGAEIMLTATTNAGYTFLGWFDGETLVCSEEEFKFTVDKSATYTAKWSVNTDTKYTVKYYLQGVDGGYALPETVTLQGTTDTTATAELKAYEHFTYNEGESVISGIISGDGSLVLSVCYTRNSYTITTTGNNEKAGTVSVGSTYKYGAEITLTATTNAGYTFKGWYDGDTRVSTEEVCTVTVEKNTTYTAVWLVNTDTKYTVEYYLEDANNGGYKSPESVECYGETGINVTAEIKTYESYKYDAEKSADTISGEIAGNGTLVLKVYYIYEGATLEFELMGGGASYKVVGIGTYKDGVLTIPAEYKDKPVTTIGANAFYHVRGIGKLVIPNSVTTIEDYAFASCLDLTEVEMGNGVTSIGKYAFAYCNQIDTLTMSNKVKTIDECAFYGCKRMRTLELPDTLTTIAKEAFKECKKLETITFGTGLTTIGEAAFYRCESLMELNLNAPTTIGNKAFMNCSSIRKVTLGKKVTSIGDEAFCNDADGDGIKMGELVIGDGVKTIGVSAFQGLRRLYKVTLGKGVTSIGENAFYKCYILREVYNRSSLLISTYSGKNYGYVANYAFYVYKSSTYTRITKDDNGLVYYTEGSAKKLISITFDKPQDLIVPNDVTEISSYACYNEQYITGVIIGENSNCTTIGAHAFQNDYNMRRLDLSGKKLTTLEDNAFYNNQEVCHIIIGTSLTTVGKGAFYKKGDTSVDGFKYYRVFYKGTQAKWEAFISSSNFVQENNGHLTEALSAVGTDTAKYSTVAFYTTSQPSSSTTTLYWRYVDGQETYW